MNKRTWIAGAALLFALLLIVLPWQTREQGEDESQRKDGQVRPLSPRQELKRKQQVMQRDMELTDELCRASCLAQAARALADANAPQDREGKLAVMRSLQQRNPRMLYLEWGEAGIGEIPASALDRVEPLLNKARQQASAGQSYVSDHIQADNKHYFVIGVPAKDGSDPMVGVVHERVIREVEVGQRKNLRIVPYPSDARYGMEAVDPDSLRKRDVDHPEDNEGTSHYYIHEVVVKFRHEPTEAELAQIRNDIRFDSVRKMGYTHVFGSKQMNARDMMEYFRKHWDPEYVEPHYVYFTNKMPKQNAVRKSGGADDAGLTGYEPNDMLFSDYQWNLPIIDTLQGWDISRGDESVIVAVLDTGVDLNHPDLQGRWIEGINIVAEGTPDDDVGHGTHVAGIIGATVDNWEGVAGMSWYNRIMPVKVLDHTGAGSTYSVAQGIIWATDHGAKVINMSLGNYVDAQFLHDAIRYAYDRDVVLVAATGNDNTEQPGYPAAYPEVFAVAATDWNNNKAVFSNFGDYVDVAAPGENIASTYYMQQYAALSGTSMASPHVAALAAMIRSVNPELNNEEVMEIMRQTAIDLGDPGKDKYYGYGLIDVKKALESAANHQQSILMWPKRLAHRLEANQR